MIVKNSIFVVVVVLADYDYSEWNTWLVSQRHLTVVGHNNGFIAATNSD